MKSLIITSQALILVSCLSCSYANANSLQNLDSLSFIQSAPDKTSIFLPASFSAEYEESVISSATGKEKKSFGRIDYKYPRHIWFEVVSPDPKTFISNPTTSWDYSPPFIETEQAQVKILKSKDLPIGRFLDSLKNGAKSNSSYSAKTEGDKLILTFTPKLQKELQMNRAILIAPGEASKTTSLSDFKELQIEYKNKNKTKMKFLSFKPNVKFESDHFVFKIPSNTKVIDQR